MRQRCDRRRASAFDAIAQSLIWLRVRVLCMRAVHASPQALCEY